MKLALTLVLCVAALGSYPAMAQSFIQDGRPPIVVVQPQPPLAVIEHPSPPTGSVVLEERDSFLGTEKKTILDNGTGRYGECSTRTVHSEDLTDERTRTRTKTDCP